MWKHILAFLREEMLRLDWVDLCHIGYAKDFEMQLALARAEWPGDPGNFMEINQDSYLTASEREEISWETGIREQDEEGNLLLLSPQPPNIAFVDLERDWYDCNVQQSCPESVETLRDDGVSVGEDKRQIWENWVLKRCLKNGCK
jgi:hypothetical protein